MEPENKKWWQSKTIIGIVVSLIGIVAPKLGLDLDSGQLTEIATQAMSLGGLILAAIGRATAKAPIAAKVI